MKKLVLSFVLIAFLAGTNFAQNKKIPLIGAQAPSFTAETTNGTVTFPDDYQGKWKILFSHPQDFTPVCSSEISELADMQREFKSLNTQIAIISTDDVTQHKSWKKWLEELDYKGHGTHKIDFPFIDDHTRAVSIQYGMLHEPVSTNKDVRGVFIIDPNNIVRCINFYPMQIGRNMQEIERVLVALQTADKESVCTPANWKEGDDVIVPHYPYTQEQLDKNPKIKDDYYNVGEYIWFKKEKKD